MAAKITRKEFDWRMNQWRRKGNKTERSKITAFVYEIAAYARNFKQGMTVLTVSPACIKSFYRDNLHQQGKSRAYLCFAAVRRIWELIGREDQPPRPLIIASDAEAYSYYQREISRLAVSDS